MSLIDRQHPRRVRRPARRPPRRRARGPDADLRPGLGRAPGSTPRCCGTGASGRATRSRCCCRTPRTSRSPTSGSLALGGVAVPVHALLKAEEIEYVLSDSGAKALICAAPLLGEGAKGAELAGVPVLAVMDGTARRHRADRRAGAVGDPDRGAACCARPRTPRWCSTPAGTTGKPKGAEITHLNVMMNVIASATYSFDITQDDVVLGCLPLFHTFGQTCCMNTVVLRRRVGGAAAALRRRAGSRAAGEERVHDLHGRADDVRRAARGRPRPASCGRA